MSIDIPKTREQWRKFMNGYRDPVGRAEDKQAREAEEDFFNEPGGGGAPGARQCGHRKEGGTYAVCPSSPFGKPVEHFLLCKPLRVDPEEYNLANVGVKLVDVDEECLACKVAPGEKPKYGKRGLQCPVCSGTKKETVTHIFDIVGREFYPNVADFLEEVRRMGVSRRLELETSANYARLSKRSRLFLLHARAIIENPYEVYKGMESVEKLRLHRAGCPKNLPVHASKYSDDDNRIIVAGKALDAPGCSSLYWNVITGGSPIPELYEDGTDVLEAEFLEDVAGRFVERKLASGRYRGYALPEGATLKYAVGVFAVFPLARIEVIDPNGEYENKVKRASSARVDVKSMEC